MRDAFVDAIYDLADSNPLVMLITADLGYGIFNKFREDFPKQFLNVGVAEQNMTGIATGMAMEGHVVFTYSIANFATIRCLEQIRNDAAYHAVNVNVVSSGGGFTYGSLGMSHHATEDLAIMRALPGVITLVPSGDWETALSVQSLATEPGVGYLRLEKESAPDCLRQGEVFCIGKARVLKEGGDLTLIATGGVVKEALRASEILEKSSYNCRVISMHSIKPIDRQIILDAASETGHIITVEEHSIIGGLGGAVAEVIAESGHSGISFERMGLPDTYSSIVGQQSYLRQKYNLDAAAISQKARQMLTD